MASQPTACLLHGAFHVMGQECWATTVDWYFEHQELTEAQRRDGYQAAVERRMLDDLRMEAA